MTRIKLTITFSVCRVLSNPEPEDNTPGKALEAKSNDADEADNHIQRRVLSKPEPDGNAPEKSHEAKSNDANKVSQWLCFGFPH